MSERFKNNWKSGDVLDPFVRNRTAATTVRFQLLRFFGPPTLFLLLGTIGCRTETAALEDESPPPASILVEPVLQPLPLGSIRPTGWLREQLRIQGEGLTGHLDEFWPDIRDSGWIGGKAEGWERLPYWLDGLVPLAFQLGDPQLIDKARRTIDYILRHQAEDGWLGPEKSPEDKYQARDPWPVFVMLKALSQYHEATGDERVLLATGRFLRALNAQLASRPLFDWNRMRWQDGVLSVHWLYERSGEAWLLEVADRMHLQGYDWTSHFEDLPHKDKAARWQHESHVVNNAMAVKAPAIWFRQSRSERDRFASSKALDTLDRYHGQAAGIFTGDECFAGKMPSQGTETCAVVELLFSLEVLAAILGEPELGDHLERVAFNALPAAFKPDMWARQYVQQSNQPVVRVSEERIYTTNGSHANLYGLETNYGCCTANMHQGWPKFVSHLWMKTKDSGLAAVAYAPASVRTALKGVDVAVEILTDYPFGERLQLEVSVDRPVQFPLMLRIPSWAAEPRLRVGDEPGWPVTPGSFHTIDRVWSGSTQLTLDLPMLVRAERRYNDALSIQRGPLVYSLRIGEQWRQVGGDLPHADWEVRPSTPWNYAIQWDPEQTEQSIRFETRPLRGNPYQADETPVRAFVRGRMVPEWRLKSNAAAPPPSSPVDSEMPLETLTLIPYGAAKLRMTEMPTLSR